ncbi:VirB8 protein [Poriferisphaera corsica]|uniref:VirB8 protein n=1 Tax=Poriferisphaera corsica TaxID=2528020 RepID=A0A517YSP5_9BACT|nr:conjugal transfer protein TrbF [Poriferisphaera corsica]QDU33257.1 VirB8 protein [Poriferisphaera corsica]
MNKTTQSFGSNGLPVELDTPFAKAKAKWDERLGMALSNNRLLRLIAIGSTSLCGILAIGLIFVCSNKQVEMFVVEIDGNKAQTIGVELSGRRYTPTNSATGYFVAEAVKLSRSRPTDKVVLAENWKRLYKFIRGDAKPRMDEYAREANGMRAKDIAKQVEVESVLQRSDDSYQVRWKEKIYTSGKLTGQDNWTGLFTVVHQAPKDKKSILDNPVGLYITNFEWSRDFSNPMANS